MKLIVGLGNPGRRYEGTRHNVGFATLRQIATNLACGSSKARFEGDFAEGHWNHEKIGLLWPLTYMNLSGRSVRAAADFFGLPLPNLLVICDDFSLPLGTIRIRESGTSGGQKGLQDICERLGSTAVPRLRIGIGSPPPEWDPADYVLGRFAGTDLELATQAMDVAAQAARCWIESGIQTAMTEFNGRHKKATRESDDNQRQKNLPGNSPES